MGFLKRDIDSITGLRELLVQLETSIDGLNTHQLSDDEHTQFKDLLSKIDSELDYVLTDLHLSETIYEVGDDEKVATVKSIREYVLGALQATGPQLSLERLTVNDGIVYLSHAPVNGQNGLLNFGRCLYRDEKGNETAHRLRVLEDETFGFALAHDDVDLNGKIVEVQYFHYHDPRDLNDLIGQLILDGLVLVTSE